MVDTESRLDGGGYLRESSAIYISLSLFSVNEWSPVVKDHRSAAKRVKGNKDG